MLHIAISLFAFNLSSEKSLQKSYLSHLCHHEDLNIGHKYFAYMCPRVCPTVRQSAIPEFF